MSDSTLHVSAAMVTRSLLSPGLRGRGPRLPAPRSLRRTPAAPAVSRAAAAARAEGAAPWSPIGLEVRFGVLQEWARALLAQIKAARLGSVSRDQAFRSVPASVTAGAPSAAAAREKLRNAQWTAYVMALQKRLTEAGITPVNPDQAVQRTVADAAAGVGGLGEFGQSIRRICSYVGGESGQSRGRGPNAPSGGFASPLSAPGAGPGRNPPLAMNTPAISGGAVAVDMGALIQDPLFPALAMTATSSAWPGRPLTINTQVPPPVGGGGDDGSGDTGGLGEDEIALGSWLSKAMGKLSDKWNVPLKQLAPGAAATGAGFIPVIGPLVSGAIGAVASVANAREATKQAEAAARAAAAMQPSALQLAPTSPQPSQTTVVVRQPKAKGGGKTGLMQQPWVIPAALAGVVGLALLNRRK